MTDQQRAESSRTKHNSGVKSRAAAGAPRSITKTKPSLRTQTQDENRAKASTPRPIGTAVVNTRIAKTKQDVIKGQPSRERASPLPSSRPNVLKAKPVQAASANDVRPSSSTESTVAKQYNPAPVQETEPALDPLQSVAQMLSWFYMTSQVNMQHRATERAVLQSLQTRAKELAEEEGEVKDSRLRHEAECMLNFLDELGDDSMSDTPALFFAFLDHEKNSSDLIALVFKYLDQQHDEDDVKTLRYCNEMLESIEQLQRRCSELVDRCSGLLAICRRETKTEAVLEAVLRMLSSRAASLVAAGALMATCKENARARLHILSLSRTS